MQAAYRAYGLRVSSAVPLPFDSLPAPVQDADVTVRLGAVPAELPGSDVVRKARWQARPGVFLIEVEGVARYLVEGGRDITVAPLGGDDADIAAFFANAPFAVLLQQRGVLTLHSSSVATGGGAALLLGESGVGKSSLAAALVERGFPLIADDVTGLVADANGRVTALPGFASLRLWADTLDEMRWRGRGESKMRQSMDKYWMPVERARATPLPVHAAFVLKANGSNVGIDPMPERDAFSLLWSNTHRARAMGAIGKTQTRFRTVAAMAQRVPVALATRPRHPFLLDALADRVAAQLDAETSISPPPRLPGRTAPPVAKTHGQQDTARDVPNRDASPAPHRRRIVWIAAWPKSGTTWLRAVLTSYLREDGGPPSINALLGEPCNRRETFDELLGTDCSDMTDEEIARHLPRFREALAEQHDQIFPEHGRGGNEPAFVKTHEAYRLPTGTPRFPQAGAAGVVYLVRNPLDVAVSYAHHLAWAIDRTIALMADPAAAESHVRGGIRQRLPEPLTTWNGHVSSWTEQTALRIHVARYEDLLASPRAGFGAIVRFAGLEWNEARLESAIEQAAFHRLQSQEAESGFAEKQPTAASFFRAGVSGSWRDVLTKAQVRALTSPHGEVMARFGYLPDAESAPAP